MAKTPSVGEPAPEISLPGTQLIDGKGVRKTFTLSEHRGTPLVVAFYPGDDTPVCTRQMCNYSSGLEEFTDLGAGVWAISAQGVDSHEKFATKHNLLMPLLADTDRTAAGAYGLGLLSGRSTFVIDGEGIVRWRDTRAGLTYAKSGKITTVLKQLTSA